ncbi:XrtA/PEP-CTERM system-associated ATPase [Sulfurirhabdus autotrophica]|uniref:Putative secretion ATPase (PEP-CTERM system associated) n=1 Tax=Sulfurirhabdus autotrophica TaxID=1706046 RepID=A0A4R3Y788_9PROT|nr:XrtA/PEP-CTERM system-associated ATPase [Sulfurirhabdus autotrophica]TCV88155.1 putative secretion ATPase (PEP-CTERM system associated) [Sulfurirhabdus autotrophica]
MYESFYKLTDKPFQLNPDPRFFFGSKGHKRAMAYLEYGLSLGEGFIVITGEVGAGKTMLVRNLVKKLENENVVTAQLVTTQLEADDTLRMVAASFGLNHENISKAALLNNLENFLQHSSKQGKRALLIVDEAQNLSPRAVEELRMLSNFQSDNKPLLQSFLLGQPEFRKTLQSEELLQLRQRVIASYHLGALDTTETQAYIIHRLDMVGWQGDPAITEDGFQLIHEYTKGIPRIINTFCDRLLLLGFLSEKHTFDRVTVQEVVTDLSQEVTCTGNSTSDEKHYSSDFSQGGFEQSTSMDLARLEQKIEGMEMTMNRMMTMMRKMMFIAVNQNKNDSDAS